jgi:hypothetical protein
MNEVMQFINNDIVKMVLSLVAGVGGAAIWLLPGLNKLKRDAEKLQLDCERIYTKYKDGLVPTVRHDVDILLQDADNLTEDTADLLGRVRMTKAEKMLRDLVKREWYQPATN